jgi:hypothetical protein
MEINGMLQLGQAFMLVLVVVVVVVVVLLLLLLLLADVSSAYTIHNNL